MFALYRRRIHRIRYAEQYQALGRLNSNVTFAFQAEKAPNDFIKNVLNAVYLHIN